MRIENKTAYSTQSLRRVLTLVHRDIARHRGRLPQWKRATCNVYYRRARWPSVAGSAMLGGSVMSLQPSRKQASTVDFAIVAWHELLHLYGFVEIDIPKTWTEANRKRWDFVAKEVGVLLPFRAAKPKAKVSPMAKAEGALARWLRRQRLATTKVKQYRKSVDYYKRKEAKANGNIGAVGQGV